MPAARTTPAKGHRLPWNPKMPRPKKPAVLVNVEALVIANDPLPEGRTLPQNKYHAKFSAMKIGQNLICDPSDIGKIGGAMRKFIQERKIKARVVSQQVGKDGKGRVWMAALEDHKK